MAKNKSHKNAGNKPKQDTSSPVTVTEMPEKTNEDKPATPKEGLVYGNKKLQLQMEREAREEEERQRIAERAKQEAKSNSAKKKSNKKPPRAQTANESNREPKLRKPTEEEYVSNKTVTEQLKVHTQGNSSGGWVIQPVEFNTQCKLEPGNDQDQSIIKSEADWETNQENTVSNTEENWAEEIDNSQQELTPKRIIKRDLSYDDSPTNSQPTFKRGWGKSDYSYQNPNRSLDESTTFNSEQQRSSFNENNSSFSANKRHSDEYRNQQKPYYKDRGSPRDNRGQQRGDYNRDDTRSRFSEPNYERQDKYSNFSNRTSNYNRAGFRHSFGRFDGKNDGEFQEFLDRAMLKPAISNGKVYEVKGDLFTATAEYSLAHCVAEDMSMGAGIAKTFRTKFGQVGYLLNQRQKTGGLAVLEEDTRFIYYLVTKEQSRGKPTLYTLWMSLKQLKQHVDEKKVTKLAIPQIGCGLDRLDWSTVQQMLEHIFQDTDIEIVVYIWDENAVDTTSTPPQRLLKKCAVIHVQMDLVDIEKGTGLVYFGFVDGHQTEVFKSLSDRYNISVGYRAPKAITDVLHTIDKGEYIYGLIIKNNFNQDNDFEVIEKTLKNLSKKLKKDKTVYIGFQAFADEKDKFIVDKIIALMQYALLDIEIWVCWPDALKEFCPQQNKSYY